MPKSDSGSAPDPFYRALQEKFRGTRESVKERLRIYSPFLEAIEKACDSRQTIDLGCGRGEWLELQIEHGFQARGVDRDEATVTQALTRGLPVSCCDALDALSALPAASHAIVAAIHVAEHLTFEDLQSLVRDAHRALAPAGLLVLETPNPENFAVATTNFYLDPTHVRPIPPQLLAFLAEFFGFARVKILRLQESAASLETTYPTLSAVIAGASADYAVVAQKAGPEPAMAASAAVFEREYGLGRDALVERFDQKMTSFVGALDLYAKTLTSEIALKNENLIAKEAEIVRLSQTAIDLQNALANASARAAAADARVVRLEAELAARRSSEHTPEQN